MARSIHHPHYKLLLAHVRELREAAGMTQADLARQLGHTQGHISKIECGDRRLDILQFIEICEVLGADPSVVFEQYMRARDHLRQHMRKPPA